MYQSNTLLAAGSHTLSSSLLDAAMQVDNSKLADYLQQKAPTFLQVRSVHKDSNLHHVACTAQMVFCALIVPCLLAAASCQRNMLINTAIIIMWPVLHE